MNGWQLGRPRNAAHVEEAERPGGTCGNPILQVGGVQEAVTEPAPGPGVLIEQLSPVHAEAATARGSEALQVSGILLKTGAPVLFSNELFPSTSVTIAVVGCAVPLLAVKLVCPLSTPLGDSCSVMLWMGQVSKKSQTRLGSGVFCRKALLETPLAEAYIWVRPGVAAVAVAWLVAMLKAEFTIGVIVTTLALFAVQVKGPTVAVTSEFWLQAVARRVMDSV